MIVGTYKLKSGVDRMEHNRKYADQIWPPTPNAGNDGYKLIKFISKDNEEIATMVKFLNPILLPK